jgi:steroid delta-isomerase
LSIARKESVVRAAIEAYFAALATGDEEAWLTRHADDAVSFNPVWGPPTESLADLRRFFRGIRSAFERLSIQPDLISEAPDGAAVKWTGRAFGRNGRQVTFEGVDVFDVDDEGRIRTVWSYWDPAEVARSLGN